MSDIISAVKDVVADEADRKKIYKPIYESFTDQDWDTVDECLGEDPAFDDVVRDADPSYFEDEDEDEDEIEGLDQEGIGAYLDGDDDE